MSTSIDQKAYLQKYLGRPSVDKKKKKKKVVKGQGFKIIDDDIDYSKLRTLEGDELDILDEGEDGPQIAGIIDERPDDVKKLEQFKTTSKWRVVNQDDGFNSKLQIEEIKKDVKEVEKENQLIFGKMYSDSEDEKAKNDSDLSPPRKSEKNKEKTNNKRVQNSDSDFSPPRRRNNESQSNSKSKKQTQNSDSDMSPPRKSKNAPQPKSNNKNYDSDQLPPHRKQNKERTRKPSRWEKIDENSRRRSPSIESPKRRQMDKSKRRDRSNSSDLSPPRKSQRNEANNDSDLSPPRKSRKDSFINRTREQSSDLSPTKKSQKNKMYKNGSGSPPRKSHKSTRDPSSDLSPPRRKNNERGDIDSDQSPPRKSRKESSTKRNREPSFDLSSARKPRRDESKRQTDNRRNRTPSSDMSPPRRRNQSPIRQYQNDRYKHDTPRFNNENNHSNNRRSSQEQSRNRPKGDNRYQRHRSPERRYKDKQDNDSDSTPPRKHNKDDRTKEWKNYRRNSDSPPPTNLKMAKTLEGKKSGLQDAKELRKENEAFRKREEEAFSKMTDDVSGRNAKAVSRKAKRETSEERQKLKEKAERQRELDEKYKKWTKGLKQVEAQEARVQEYMHEASKPLARHKDDRDLEQNLRQIERDGDPMLQYIRERKVERGELPPEKPKYKGNFPPNRFNIRPGYRWDGVDRSNGYEKKFFEQQSKKKAQEEEAYKWSTEDL